ELFKLSPVSSRFDFALDGKSLVSLDDFRHPVRLDLGTGEKTRYPTEYGGSALAVLSTDAFLLGGAGGIRLYDQRTAASTRPASRPFPSFHRGAVMGLKVSADGRRLVSSANDLTLGLWDGRGTPLARIAGLDFSSE